MAGLPTGGRDTIDDLERQLWTFAYRVRHVSVVVIAVLVLALPGVGEFRYLVAVYLILVVLPLDLLLSWWSRRTGHYPTLMLWLDFVSGALIVALAPTLFSSVLILAVAVGTIGATLYGVRDASIAVGFGLVGIGLVGAAAEAQDVALGVAAVGLSVAVAMAVTGTAAARERTARRRYFAIINGIEAVVYEIDSLDPLSISMVSSGELNPGVEPPVAANRFFSDRVHPDDLEDLIAAHTAATKNGHARVEFRVRDDAGNYRTFVDRIVGETDREGEFACLRGVLVEVSEQRATSTRLRTFGRIVNRVHSGIMIVGLADDEGGDLRVTFANPEVGELFHLDAGAVVGSSLRAALRGVSEVHADLFDHRLRAALVGEIPVRSHTLAMLEHDVSRRFLVEVLGVGTGEAALIIREVTSTTSAEHELRRRTQIDQLTGLKTRAALIEAIYDARESVPDSCLLAVFDLDRFKEVNDALGHDVGDRVLTQFAQRLLGAFPAPADLGRLGGNQFAVCLHDGASATDICQRLDTILAAPLEAAGTQVSLGASIGTTDLSPEQMADPLFTPLTLLRDAEVAMYEAKRTGEFHVEFRPGLNHASSRNLQLAAELGPAIDRGQLEFHYQPIVDLDRGDICGFEGLARWQHPQRGLIPPGSFIELAEVSGQINAMTRRLLDLAVSKAAELLTEGYPAWISVNLSARVLQDKELADFVERLLDQHGVEGRWLKVEVTETAAMKDPAAAEQILDEIASLGVGVAIDDFGTGYSSLAYLKSLPVSIIKVDRSFVIDMAGSDHDATIVRATIDLAHSLGMRALAEGVETERSLQMLRAQGCDMAQGYHFARALPPESVIDWLRSRSLEATTQPALAANTPR